MTDMLRIAVAGCAGRMGRTLLQLVENDEALSLAGALEHEGSPYHGKPLSSLLQGLPDSLTVGGAINDLNSKIDVLIDFTTPFATIEHIGDLVERSIPTIIGTTGFKPEQLREIEDAAKHIPVVRSGNMSLGVNLLTELVRRAAASLGDEFDIEIHESHHRHKVDAPSGTALMLGHAAARGRKVELEEKSVRVRDGIMEEREAGQIGFSVTRAGGIVGDHQVLFGSEDEIITLSHRATDRSLFARGALTAAKWVQGRKPGLYTMRDVLGLN
ncbi:4-hydroxy-tetrahydrodipicolinate reductase [Parvularcula sp. IMCC14364]|uniref:4-hydroxy-tetrahydrodipicolinate reductase n=1 Tax=Parvularcula sp. IMCC14364 TaxID=3067902 RepID=UPI002740D3D5|nr:4-hydroxy-tetrahydrodipicolinate reductase [Parvularcula sp. IMCC14364]